MLVIVIHNVEQVKAESDIQSQRGLVLNGQIVVSVLC